MHPTRAIQFLVGVRGGSKDNAAAIGGSWSPSLDGPDPGTNPATLVKTAIRTCKALTGIDLSGCTKWCRFLEIHYRRQVRNDYSLVIIRVLLEYKYFTSSTDVVVLSMFSKVLKNFFYKYLFVLKCSFYVLLQVMHSNRDRLLGHHDGYQPQLILKCQGL